MKTAETPAGIFTINKVKIPSAYTCAAEQKIEYISENHVQIITMNQAVSFGDQILSPRICQSCMNPEHIYEGAAQPLSRHKKWSCRCSRPDLVSCATAPFFIILLLQALLLYLYFPAHLPEHLR